MAGISLIYNGVDLSQWFDITDVQRNLGTTHSNTMVKVGQSDGQLWQYMSRDAKTITITGIITNANLANLRRELGAAVDTDEPQQLIIGDDTGVYYLAIYDGQPTIAEDWRSGTISLTFIVPDGVAHSIDTKTANNMPYKDVPVNLAIASHASASNTTIVDGYEILMGLSEDLAGKTITTSAKVIVTNYQGKIDPNSGDPDIEIKDGMSTGNWNGLINPINVTGNGVYTSVPSTTIKNPLTGTSNQFGLKMYNLNATIEVWIKVELGTSASPWSPNPADPEYYSDTITVQNAGSYKSYPVINVTMASDNGYIGLANSAGGYLEFGNSEEVDGVTQQKTEHALALGMDSEPSGVVYNSGASNYDNYVGDSSKPNKRQGTITYGRDAIGGTAALPTYINGSYWAGPSMYLPISANSNGFATGNFSYAARGVFNTDKKALGRLEQVLQSGSNVAFESVLRDSTSNADQIVWEAWIKNTLVKTTTLNRKVFVNNKFIQTQIMRIGGQIKFVLGVVNGFTGSTVKVASPVTVSSTRYDLADLAIDGWSAWFERWQGNEHVISSLSDVRFDWVNVDYWVDEPNRWSNGDVVTIDCVNKQVLTNGVPDLTLQTVGNHWDDFYLAPGTNEVDTACSSWATQPRVDIYYQEAYV